MAVLEVVKGLSSTRVGKVEVSKSSLLKVYTLSERVYQNEMCPPSQDDVKEACLSLFRTLVKNGAGGGVSHFLFLIFCL